MLAYAPETPGVAGDAPETLPRTCFSAYVPWSVEAAAPCSTRRAAGPQPFPMLTRIHWGGFGSSGYPLSVAAEEYYLLGTAETIGLDKSGHA